MFSSSRIISFASSEPSNRLNLEKQQEQKNIFMVNKVIQVIAVLG